MTIEHAALWTEDLERSRSFYERHFGGVAGPKYRNDRTGFESYFISFGNGARLEIMRRPGMSPGGLAHIAFRCDDVDAVTEELRAAGCTVAGEPRRTGDGYYESVVLDPDGNRIELTAASAVSSPPAR
jgi:lactoylglutathione lyase